MGPLNNTSKKIYFANYGEGRDE